MTVPDNIAQTGLPIQINETKKPQPTARIYGISGSTHYVLKGLYPINGKKITTLEEIDLFYHNYEKILEDTKISATTRQEEILNDLITGEQKLETLLKESNNSQRNANKSFWTEIGYKFQGYLRTHKVKKELGDIRTRKANLIGYKEKNIQNECNRVTDSFNFIEQNKSFLIGAYAEEQVIDILSQLSDEYHIINDVNLRFNPPIFWKEKNDNILTSQIDHIAIGPTGIFLIETKNWKPSDIDQKSDDLKFQVRRSSYALWRYLIKHYRIDSMPKIRNVIVSKYCFNSNQRLDKFIDIIIPDELSQYITRRETIL